MRKLLWILVLLVLPGALAFSMLDALSILDPFVSGTFSVTVDGSNAPFWNQSISNVTINQNSGSTVVDSDMTLSGNGQCVDADNTTPTFAVASENTSAVDCSISSTELSITPATGFTGNDSCIISCSDTLNSTNSTFTITVNAVAAEEEAATPSASGGGGGGGGSFFAPSPGADIISFEIIPEVITIELNRGQTATKTFTVSNFREVLRIFKIKLRGIASLAVVQDEVSVDAQGASDVGINFYVPSGTRIGVYSGSIDVESETIGVVVEIKSRDTDSEIGLTLQESKSIPIDGKVDSLRLRAIYPGQALSPKLDLSSFFERGFTLLNVDYQILNSDNQVVYSETVETQISAEEFVKELDLPVNIVPGRYVLSVSIDEEGASGAASKTFDIKARSLFADESVVQISIALALIAGGFILYIHRRWKVFDLVRSGAFIFTMYDRVRKRRRKQDRLL
ncbi:hypothetical protein HOE39_01730 [Candidatus Woesearchaeota archaeon]|jgi:hypothetical protein|nr:hypothetical protein [Candidatus Woesearchaeota archaeon]